MRYKTTNDGVFDNEKLVHVSGDPGNIDTQVFLAWKNGVDLRGDPLPGEPGPQEPDPKESVAELKDNVVRQVRDLATQARLRITGGADPIKAAAWNVKAFKAAGIVALSASQADVDIFKIEAKQRDKGETVQELAALVLAKTNAYSALSAMVDGVESRLVGLARTIEAFYVEDFLRDAADTFNKIVIPEAE